MEKTDLLGTWSLVRSFETRDDRVVDPAPLGPHPSGFIHYLEDDRMAVVIAHSGRQPLSTGSRRDAPESELAQAARTLDAYAGSYSVTAPDTVVHHLEISSFQNDQRADYVRTMEIIDGELHLGTPSIPMPDGMRGMKLVWRRLDA